MSTDLDFFGSFAHIFLEENLPGSQIAFFQEKMAASYANTIQKSSFCFNSVRRQNQISQNLSSLRISQISQKKMGNRSVCGKQIVPIGYCDLKHNT